MIVRLDDYRHNRTPSPLIDCAARDRADVVPECSPVPHPLDPLDCQFLLGAMLRDRHGVSDDR